MAVIGTIIVKDPESRGELLFFRGTRVPLQAQFDSIEAGETLEAFLEGFPSVTREMTVDALVQVRELLSTKF